VNQTVSRPISLRLQSIFGVDLNDDLSNVYLVGTTGDGRSSPNGPRVVRGLLLVFISTVAAFILMYVLQLAVQWLSYEQRVPVFLAFSALYLFWPLVAKIVPRVFLFAVCCFPLFGIWLALRYTSDIGPDSYMFAAQPACFAGAWGVFMTTAVTYTRLR
jgi:hypothetical protein